MSAAGYLGRYNFLFLAHLISIPLRGFPTRTWVTRYALNLQPKQNRQCTYNMTLRRVRETIVAAEKQ